MLNIARNTIVKIKPVFDDSGDVEKYIVRYVGSVKIEDVMVGDGLSIYMKNCILKGDGEVVGVYLGKSGETMKDMAEPIKYVKDIGYDNQYGVVKLKMAIFDSDCKNFMYSVIR